MALALENLPLLSLVMIVKDEAASIQLTIDSVRSVVDRYTIIDTGSTDGTPQILADALRDLPGELIHEAFVDYAATRNRVLECAGQQSVFTLMLSGDETVLHGDKLRQFCEDVRDVDDAIDCGYLVNMQWGSLSFWLPRLLRTNTNWRYVGRTHEVLAAIPGHPLCKRVPDAAIVHDLAHCDHERKRRTWARDLEILSEELAAHPDDARTAFYLAQTYEDLGRYDEAMRAYQRRVAMGGWQEEVYEALFRRARCAEMQSLPWTEVQQLYLDAYAYRPRAEPLFYIAHYWWRNDNYALAHLFAKRAVEVPFPRDDVYFVEPNIYQFERYNLLGIVAYYVGDFVAGAAAVRAALEVRPHDEQLLHNLSFYPA